MMAKQIESVIHQIGARNLAGKQAIDAKPIELAWFSAP